MKNRTYILVVTIICGLAAANSGYSQQYNIAERNFHLTTASLDFSTPEYSMPALAVSTQLKKQKSQLVALGYAMLPGFFIPAAFGHAYAGADREASVLSVARLSGRIMWMYSFFDNLFIENADGSIGSGNEMLFFSLGLALDIGGYLYDTIFSTVEVAEYNRKAANHKRSRIVPFIDIRFDGPCCGIEFRI